MEIEVTKSAKQESRGFSHERFKEHHKENGANEDFLYGCLCMMNYAVKVAKSCLIEQKVEKHDAE